MESAEEVESQIAALERQTSELQRNSSATIAANLEQLTALQRQLEDDRTRLQKQQKRTNPAPLVNVADLQQQRALELEVNELRRRRDFARDANRRSEQRLAQLLEQTDRLNFHLNTPANTPYPTQTSARGSKKSPGQRLEDGMRNLGVAMRQGPAGSAMRASLRPQAHTAVNLADSGAAQADRLAAEKQQRELDAAEARLARAQQRRDTYEFMAERLRLEKQQFDPRFQAAYAELQREKKRKAQMRIASGEAIQQNENATATRRATEKRIALRQRRDKEALQEQQATLLSTQQSVLHFEVSRMSRSASAIHLERMPKTGGSYAATESLTAGMSSSYGTSAFSDASNPLVGSASDAAGGGVGGADAISLAAIGEESAGSVGLDLPLDPAELQLQKVWERLMAGTGVSEPMDLIHKALEQLDARAALESLDVQTEARLRDLLDEGEQLARRKEKSDSATMLASMKRLERLHELVNAAEKELSKATAALAVSDSSVAAARQTVTSLDAVVPECTEVVARSGVQAPGYVRIADPLGCDPASLPAVMQSAADTILLSLRALDAHMAAQEAQEAHQAAEAERLKAEAAKAEEVSAFALAAKAREDASKAEAALAEATRAEDEARAAAAAAGAGVDEDGVASAPMFPPLSPGHLSYAEMA